MQSKKMSFKPISLSVSIFAASAISLLGSNSAVQAQNKPDKKPTIGTVKSMVMGDLMCYVDLVDNKGIKYNLGASFDFCAREKTFLNKKVRLSYRRVSVNDCQSAEPCGKHRFESLITKMKVIR